MNSHSKIIFVSTLTSLFVAIPKLSYAHNKVGNGGNSVVCETSGKITTARLLDFYESNLSPAPTGSEALAIALKQVEKLKTTAPKLEELYARRLHEMQNEIDYRNDIALTDMQDSKHLFQPNEPGCKTVQTAIRRESPSSDEKRFLIRKDIWDALKPVDRAGLLVHEVVYEHFSKLGETDSVKARRMNRYLFSHAAIDSHDFWTFVKELEIPIYP